MEGLLIQLVILVIVVGVLAFLINSFIPPGMMQKIAWAVLVVIVAIWAIRILGGGGRVGTTVGYLLDHIMLA